MTGFTKGPELSLVERLLQRAEQKKRRAAYTGLPRMEAMLADARLDREAADALAEQAAVREELCGALRPFADVMPIGGSLWGNGEYSLLFEDGERKLESADFRRARAALAKAAPEQSEE